VKPVFAVNCQAFPNRCRGHFRAGAGAISGQEIRFGPAAPPFGGKSPKKPRLSDKILVIILTVHRLN
jgi:hypothetical protein